MSVLLVIVLSVLALLVARLVGAPRRAWRYVAVAAALALGASLLAPRGDPYRAEVAAWARAAVWTGAGLAPVAAYALWVRSLRRQSGAAAVAEAPPSRPRGLVQFDDDAALAAETAAALAAEAPGARVSLGWRGADGGLEGHVRLRVAGETAEIEMLRVEPAARGRGVGGALLRAAEGEATARGARRIGAAVGEWQSPGMFARAGYVPVGGPAVRRWLEKPL
ncbi:GNAT family N-acetyltransferase [Amaricoccus sp.]|uniref:GNAT family N-acetyltransferase n=1 Tax=Amaricoccus sp. TaxID=1872485 RepID=UPI001B5A7950|nr:GNAT family N-acetyltransferase [Amaricoccus sp.]MBP7002634.1 GNAT family N-acetyltransferase [Amaricoccus sp.]